MTIDKLEYLWAESGTTTPAPTDEKIQEGFVGGDRPTIERFNWLHNRAETKLNKIQRERVDSFYEDATDAQLMLMTGQWDESWGFPGDSSNIMAGGAAKSYRSMCLWFDSSDNPHLIVADETNDKFEVWDCRGMTNTDTSDDWHDDLPTGSGEDWQVQSICTDGSSVFGLFWDATNDTYQIQGWDVATWDVTSGWAATGTALPGSGTSGLSTEGEIIVASPTKLATRNYWSTIAAASDPAVSIIDITDGTIDASGSGDAFTILGACTSSYGLASDGTNIYFAVRTGGTAYVAVTTIANPQIGIGGSWAAGPLSCGSDYVMSLLACGPNLIISFHYYSVFAVGNIVIRTHNASIKDGDSILLGQDEAATQGNEVYLDLAQKSVFDGLNAWVLGRVDDGTDYSAGLLKIDVSKFIHKASQDKNRQLADIASIFRIQTPAGDPTGADLSHVKPVFDGRDVWVVVEPDGSQTLSGNIYRLPLALLRS